jgi:Hint module
MLSTSTAASAVLVIVIIAAFYRSTVADALEPRGSSIAYYGGATFPGLYQRQLAPVDGVNASTALPATTVSTVTAMTTPHRLTTTSTTQRTTTLAAQAPKGYEWAAYLMGRYRLRYNTNYVEQCPEFVELESFSLVFSTNFDSNSRWAVQTPVQAVEVLQTDIYADGTRCSSHGVLSLRVVSGDATARDNLVVSGRDDSLRGCHPYKMRGSTTFFSDIRRAREQLVERGRIEDGMFEWAVPGEVKMGFTDSGSITPWGCWYEKDTEPPTIDTGVVPVNETLNWSGHATCFPDDATVHLESGATKRMDELQIGDRVKAARGIFSAVYMFSHKIADTVNSFVEISTSSGNILYVTPGHFIYINDVLSPSGTVRVGDSVLLGSDSRARVTSVRMVTKRGLYNPHTLHGDIIVNNVRASTYTTAIDPKIAHFALSVFRGIYRVIGADASAGIFHNGASLVSG